LGVFPDPLQRLIESLGELPGVGEQTAERLAFHLLQSKAEHALALAKAIQDVKQELKACRICNAVCLQGTCEICADPARDRSLILVVESERELGAFERMGRYTGTYHVLGVRGVAAARLHIDDLRRLMAGEVSALLARCKTGVREVILATNPDKRGDLVLALLEEALKGASINLSRLARGLPQGAHIEWLGVPVLEEALQQRRPLGGGGA
jgi:recombination protein RecR